MISRINYSLMIASFVFSLIQAELSGPITSQVVSPGEVQYSTAYWYSESKAYVNGGVTFTFPTNLFLQTPTVVVSISTTNYSLSNYNYVVTSLSATSVTVRVNISTLLNILEAGNNSCTVHVWAIGTAN